LFSPIIKEQTFKCKIGKLGRAEKKEVKNLTNKAPNFEKYKIIEIQLLEFENVFLEWLLKKNISRRNKIQSKRIGHGSNCEITLASVFQFISFKSFLVISSN
jgi:hypothetical protein